MHILIADDHAVVRRGLRRILSETFPCATFSEAANAAELFDLLPGSQTGLIVLDIHMPGRNGLEIIANLKQLFPRIPVVVLSVEPEKFYALRCLKAGASAYLTKESAPQQIATAVNKVLCGGRYISAKQAELIFPTFSEVGRMPLQSFLSRREHDVMSMIVAGLPLTEIAHRLQLCVKTVSSYRARVLAKMRAKNNAELIRYALNFGLISSQETAVPPPASILSPKKPAQAAQEIAAIQAKMNQ